MEKPKIIYLTSQYKEKNIERRIELDACFKHIVSDGQVDELWILREELNDKNHEGVTTTIPFYKPCLVTGVIINHRPTYNDFFRLANKVAKEGDIVIIANTDIYPSHGVRKHLESMKPNDCYALSRYDVKETLMESDFFDRWDSQDVWIFKAPIRNIDADFGLGIAGTDNAIAERIYQQSYNISNPSKTIQFNHLHLTGVRNYNPDIKVPKPYLLITPHFLGEEPKYHHINQ